MKLSINTTETKEIDLELPAFFRSKNGYYYRAVLSENDYRQLFVLAQVSTIRVDSPDNNKREIAEAFQTYDKITEVDFFEKYDAVLESVSLTPTLKP